MNYIISLASKLLNLTLHLQFLFRCASTFSQMWTSLGLTSCYRIELLTADVARENLGEIHKFSKVWLEHGPRQESSWEAQQRCVRENEAEIGGQISGEKLSSPRSPCKSDIVWVLEAAASLYINIYRNKSCVHQISLVGQSTWHIWAALFGQGIWLTLCPNRDWRDRFQATSHLYVH